MSPQIGPPDWQLERYRLGELAAGPEAAVQRWLGSEDGDAARRRLEALERDDAEILAQHPPRAFAAAVRERLAVAAAPRRRPRPAPALALGAALAACLAVLLPAGLRPAPDVTRVKGLSPHLLVFRQRPTPAAEVERLLSGSTARHHDLVQLAYQAAGRGYGVIVSIDGRGVLTRHLPAHGGQAVPLDPGPATLPESYELDDAPAFERFYLVTADAPFPVETVVEAVMRRHARPEGAGGDGRLDLPPSLEQSTFVLRKEPPS